MAELLVAYLYIFGIALIAIGVMSVFATDLIRKKFFNKLLKISDFKKFAPIPIFIGVLFFIALPYNRNKIFVLLLGILSITKGIVMVVAKEKIEKLKDWLAKANNSTYRIYGVIIAIIGSIVLMGI